MRNRTTFNALLDTISVTLVFALFVSSRPGPVLHAVTSYFYSFLIFLGLWLVISVIAGKYHTHQAEKIAEIYRNILIANILILGVATTIMYLVRVAYYSRTVVFGTILVATFVELLWGTMDYYLRTAIIEPPEVDTNQVKQKRASLKEVLTGRRILRKGPAVSAREEAILVEINKDAFDYVFSVVPIESPDTLVVSTTTRLNIEMQLRDKFDSVVNLKRINDIRYLNKFFETINSKLLRGGIFIGYVESKDLRKERILAKFPPVLNYIAYFFDFIIKRVFPKFILTKKLYFFLTRGQNRVLTKAETYGRLYSCGFEIIDEQTINRHLFFVARKTREPHFPLNPSYGPFVRLERVGYKGKMITVYKLRTMHPYAEYLQEYIYNTQGLETGGKFKSDFRVSTLGRFFRKFWLDELPMLINWIKRDMKLVGVRPLSSHYFSLYSEELQERRINYKPGLIPPFYADNPKTLEEIMESEVKYMDKYDKHPFRTDFTYFFKAIFNILFKRYRSH